MTTIEYLIDAAFDIACDVWSETGVMQKYYLEAVTKENYIQAIEELAKYILNYNDGLSYCEIGSARISKKRARKEAKKYLDICIEKADSSKLYYVGDCLNYGAFLTNH